MIIKMKERKTLAQFKINSEHETNTIEHIIWIRTQCEFKIFKNINKFYKNHYKIQLINQLIIR